MDTHASVPESCIFLGHILKALEPFVTASLSGVLTVVGSLAARRLYQIFGVQLTDSQWAIVHSAALAAAGKFWAAAEPSIVSAKIHVGSPGIADAAQAAIDAIPKIVEATGVTPEDMASLIVSKIGILQSAAAGRGVASPVERSG